MLMRQQARENPVSPITMAAEDERRPADDLLSDLSRDPRVREALLRTLEQLAASGVQLPVAAAPDEGNA